MRRLVEGGVIIWLVATATFFLLHLAPGDPITATLNRPGTPPEVRAHWREVYGLDRPLPEQYWRYLTSVARGELGFSIPHQRPVRMVLAEAVPNTLILMGAAIVATFAIGIVIGVIQARHRGDAIDVGLTVGSIFFYSLPDFWLALMMLLIFAYWLRLFPVTGMYDPVMAPYYGFWGKIADRLWHLVLPVTTLTLLTTGGVAHLQRGAILDAAHDDFVRTARAKGVSERGVVYRHILRNALRPIITLFGLSLPALLAGSVFVEKIFSWPGMGMVTVDAIGTRDYPLLTAAVIVASALVVIGNLIADALGALADPRLRTP
ncbi:MAG: ABC transporter permease [Gemmatimonadaceae bacterium]|nr:ABC transporter permease [Gemmatimonadaceae bacterium]